MKFRIRNVTYDAIPALACLLQDHDLPVGLALGALHDAVYIGETDANGSRIVALDKWLALDAGRRSAEARANAHLVNTFAEGTGR